MTKYKKILFGGTPDINSPETWAEVRAKWPAERRKEYEAFESFRKSPANKGLVPESGKTGATLEQIYNFIKLIGAEKYCLLSTDQPEVPAKEIKKVIRLTSPQMIESLKQINETDGKVLSTLLHYDGRTGHCIVLDNYDKNQNRFFYKDPWPWDSLLSKKKNEAGVNARKEKSNFWSVTDKELESVIFAVFVYPGQWDRMQRILIVPRLNDLKEGDFFKFFHLAEIVRYKHENETEFQYSPANFKGIVVISLLVSNSDRIKSAKLLMNKDWMKQYFLLVPDITRSFLKAFAPDKDMEYYQKICESLRPNKITEVVSNPVEVKENDYNKRFILSLAGTIPEDSITFDYSILDIDNTISRGFPVSEITIVLP